MCSLLLLLSTVLLPIPAGVRFKPTICVAQEDTIIFAEDEEEIASKINDVYAGYTERGLPIVPKLVFLGRGLDNLTGRYFMQYRDLRYEAASAGRAIDVLIKFTAVLGIPYSKVSKLVWHFISGVIYGIPQRESYANINKLHSFLLVKQNQFSTIHQNDSMHAGQLSK